MSIDNRCQVDLAVVDLLLYDGRNPFRFHL